ncbi:MAG TPA: effector binding domain-containing protein [Candidatus Scatavimonas merdigallinarum]|uniref:Effector binding domain-containing protein n=1 Tax=Candidatus Scatavimonas merdigallinarum TaxID=2840914 RepID=A0A9D1CUG7_9FIRM|nr:effector binding domain-containing protein [Candidatus Scatavimonas merdigallinarum]
MEYEIVNLPEKLVAGIAARTNNHAPDMGRVIGGLWARFYQDGLYENIPNKADDKAIGLYTDYVGDADDDYTAMVCCAVTEETEASGYALRKIPAGPYAKFVLVCNMDTAVAQIAGAWQEIWKMDLPRTYICDYEEYQDNRREGTEIHLYIGLKEKQKDEI